MKRFTETDKWKDKWFRNLKPEFKLVWAWLLDNCDGAGSVEPDEDLIEFQIGCSVDWELFLEAMEGRVQRLDCGRLWIVKFIEFQHGELGSSNPHKPVWRAIEKYQIPYRQGAAAEGITNPSQPIDEGFLKGSGTLQEPLANPSQETHEGLPKVSIENPEALGRLQDIDKDKGKDKGKAKDQGKAKDKATGEPFSTPGLAEVLKFFESIGEADQAEEFFDHYTANGWVQGKNKPLKDWRAAARNWARRKSQFASGRPGASQSLDEGVLT